MPLGLPTKQDNLDIQIKCPYITEAVVRRAEITEVASSLFYADVFLQTTKQVDIEKLIDSEVTLSFKIDEKQTRYFSGIIEQSSFENIPSSIQTKTDNILYIKIVSTLARTIYTQKYRIFQEMSVSDIISKILKENNIANYKINLRSKGKNKIEFCVQYGESDFDFISRLMETNGIFYFFEHTKSHDNLVISDVSSSAKKLSEELKVRKVATNATMTTNTAYNVSYMNSMGVRKIESFSYNYHKAEVLSALSNSSEKLNIGEKEFYDQLFLEKSIGNSVSKTILEQENVFTKKLKGNSFNPFLSSGTIFKISGSETKIHNGEFFVFSIKHYINQIPDDSGNPIYYNSFSAIPSQIPFVPLNIHQKPRIFSCQTAMVTGTSGEEIFCDENARIKLKFHWDSRSQKDEKSSCWIRVAQSWAGNKFGFLGIPRIGMEVIVEFVNGDIDQPIVVGCVYNGVNLPPSNYAKEQNTVSSFYTNTVKGKGNNELRFNDKAKEEEIFIHAQKNFNSVIEDSVSETLNEGSKKIILESKKEATEHSLIIKKGNNKITLNDGDYVVVMDKGNHSVTLKDGNRTITLSKGDLKIDVKGNISITSTKDISISADGKVSISSKKATSIDSKDIIDLKALKDFKFDCMKCSGKAKMAMEFSALSLKADMKTTVEIAALSVKIAAKANFELSAMAAAMVKSTAMLQLQGAAGIALQGAMIKLN